MAHPRRRQSLARAKPPVPWIPYLCGLGTSFNTFLIPSPSQTPDSAGCCSPHASRQSQP